MNLYKNLSLLKKICKVVTNYFFIIDCWNESIYIQLIIRLKLYSMLEYDMRFSDKFIFLTFVRKT